MTDADHGAVEREVIAAIDEINEQIHAPRGRVLTSSAERLRNVASKTLSRLTASEARVKALEGALAGLIDASPALIVKAIRKPEDEADLVEWARAITGARALPSPTTREG